MQTVDVVHCNVENLGEVRQRRKGGAAAIGTCQIFECDVRSHVRESGRDAEHTGNNTELESSRQRVLQWRWVKASSMKQALEIDADKRQADRSRDFIESIIIELHRVAVGAKRR
jgi:hypothetical protein